MQKDIVRSYQNGLHVLRLSDGHGAPRYRVLKDKQYIGKTKDGGYSSLKSAEAYVKKNYL